MITALGILTGAAAALFIGAAASVRLRFEKTADVERTIFRVLGVGFTFSRYDPDRFVTFDIPHDESTREWAPAKLARPFNGAALGVAWSFWIYARGWARGWARVRDWALPAYLHIIVADIAVTTESGDCVIKPAKRYKPGEHVRVGIANRNPCRAIGDITADVVIEHDDERTPGLVWVGNRTTWGRTYTVEPSETRFVELEIVSPHYEVIIERVKYTTTPTGDFRTGRLHGRPEWEAV